MKQVRTRTWAEINLANLEHNYYALRAILSPGCKFVGVVKANAYGHGAIPVARRLEQLGAEYLAVACLDEAEELRLAGIGAPILVLGYTPPQRVEELMVYRLTQTVYDLENAKLLSDAAQSRGQRITIHLKADTGMSRLGWVCRGRLDEVTEEMARVCAMPGLEAEGIFTHFANADQDEQYTKEQFALFTELLHRLKDRGVEFPIRHCASSAAVLNFPWSHMDMVRPGIALYGHYPDPSCHKEGGPQLRPVMELKTRVAEVKDVAAGTPVSYGCTHVLKRDTRLAVLTIGYADGMPRLCSDRWQVQIGGSTVPVVGRVCMDMCMADVTGLSVQAGDEAKIFGAELPVEGIAQLAGSIQYEILCGVSPRVHREYLDE